MFSPLALEGFGRNTPRCFLPGLPLRVTPSTWCNHPFCVLGIPTLEYLFRVSGQTCVSERFSTLRVEKPKQHHRAVVASGGVLYWDSQHCYFRVTSYYSPTLSAASFSRPIAARSSTLGLVPRCGEKWVVLGAKAVLGRSKYSYSRTAHASVSFTCFRSVALAGA